MHQLRPHARHLTAVVITFIAALIALFGVLAGPAQAAPQPATHIVQLKSGVSLAEGRAAERKLREQADEILAVVHARRVEHPDVVRIEPRGCGRERRIDVRLDERLEAGSKDLYAEALEFMERYVVTRVLRVCEGNQSKAARMLGITRGCLRSKVRALKVSIDTLVQVEGRVHAAGQDDFRALGRHQFREPQRDRKVGIRLPEAGRSDRAGGWMPGIDRDDPALEWVAPVDDR